MNARKLVVFTSALSLTLVSSAVASTATITSIATLEQQAKARTGVNARVPLMPPSSPAFRDIDSLEVSGSDRVPNYLRALAIKPAVVKAFAHLVKAIVYGGTVQPALKLAMATRIAQANGSAYSVAYLTRLLRTTNQGTAFLTNLRNDRLNDLQPGDRLALRWAELQTKDIYGMSDDEFRQLRGCYNDSEIVELTFTVSFFNYFTRLADSLGLPVEPWVLDASAKPAVQPPWSKDRAPARLALISDDEITISGAALAAVKRAAARPGGLGLGMLNAQRAMMRVPTLSEAWREFGAADPAASEVGRDLLLQVSFAVSMANGCRYCTMHQVVGLRRLGIDPAKLLAMEKSDEALTPRERVAVLFARKVTAAPVTVTDADYAGITREFHDQGALAVLMQACYFNFMNRFTDGLRLPPEDEAITINRDIYQKDFTRRRDNVAPR